MPRLAVLFCLTGLAAVSAAQTLPGRSASAPGGAGQKSATGPAKWPLDVKVPDVSPERLAELVAQLADRKFQVRREARQELLKVVELPGVAAALVEQAKAVSDVEVKAALEDILSDVVKPLAIVMHQFGGEGVPTGYGPLLYVAGDGCFIYDRASLIFTGKGGFAGSDFRQGQLTPGQLLAVKQMLDLSGLAARPGGLAPEDRAGAGNPTLAVCLRSGKDQTGFSIPFRAEEFAAGATFDPDRQELRLLTHLRSQLAACPSRPYPGPWVLRIEFHPPPMRKMSLEDRKALPDWPLAEVRAEHAQNAPGGLPLTPNQAEKVKQVLAKTSLFKIHRLLVCQVWMEPHLPAPGEKDKKEPNTQSMRAEPGPGLRQRRD